MGFWGLRVYVLQLTAFVSRVLEHRGWGLRFLKVLHVGFAGVGCRA